MSESATTIDLGRLRLGSGEGRRLDSPVRIADFEFGGQSYGVPGSTDVRLDVSRTVHGYALRLRFSAELSGPCMRCLEAAAPTIEVDAREVDQPGGGEELTSPYLDAEELDVASWAHDALAISLPAQILCRPDCRGLCPVCGVSLNDDPGHAHEAQADPRWAKLRGLRIE
jgi:uncharacterized protein